MVPAPSSTVRAALAAFRALGLDTRRLQAEAGLGVGAVDDQLGVVPVSAFVSLWRAAADADGRPAFPVRAGLATPLGAIPLLEPLVDTAPTVGDALLTLADRFYLASVAVGVDVVGGAAGRVPVEVRFRTRPGLPRFAAAEAWAATIVLARLRAVLPDGVPDVVERVVLPKAAGDPDAAAVLLGVPVALADGHAALVVAPSVVSASLRTADVAAHAVLGAAADHVGTARRRGAPLAEAVAHLLPAALAQGEASVSAVAGRLGYSARSLQRRLAAEGTSFSTLLDAHRSAEARRLLATTDRALSEIAADLGYAEQSAFTRAFVRWEGSAPLRWRRERSVTR